MLLKFLGPDNAQTFAVPVEKHDDFHIMYDEVTNGPEMHKWLKENAIILSDYLAVYTPHMQFNLITDSPMED